MAWFDRNPGSKKVPENEKKVPEKVAANEGEKTVQPEARPAPAAAPTPVAAPVVAPTPTAAPKTETPSKTLETGLVAHLYKGSRVNGQLNFQGSAKIDGSIDGEIRCNGTLTIGEGAEVKARISGQVVVIRGRVDGNVSAKEKVELAAPARLYGNINTPRLVVGEGVVFDGDCSMGVAKDKGGVASSHSANVDKPPLGQAPKLHAEGDK
jgi:cytoskeletal protein CcmA (bactofilin family)